MEESGFHMLLYKNRVVITGGTGRFAKSLKKIKTRYNVYFPSKTQLNIQKEKSILRYLKKKKPKYLIHLAGLSRTMSIHDKDIAKSINLNIIGTANIVKMCEKMKVDKDLVELLMDSFEQCFNASCHGMALGGTPSAGVIPPIL